MRCISSFALIATACATVLADPYPTDFVQSTTGFATIDRPVVEFAIGTKNVAAVLENGDVVCWGNGAFVNGLRKFAKPAKHVAVADGRAFAILSDSSLVSWGTGSWDWQLDIPRDLGKVVAISASKSVVSALLPDGSMRAWGLDSAYIQPPKGLKGLRSIESGNSGTMALTTDGKVVVVARDSMWVVDSVGDVVSLHDFLFLRQNGKISVVAQDDVDSVVSLARGRNHYLALRANGQVLAWGDTAGGRCDIPAGLGKVKAIDADEGFSIALLEDGRLVTWGTDSLQRTCLPYVPNRATMMSVGLSHMLAILPDSTVASWGAYYEGPYQTPRGLAGVVDVGVGYIYAAALRKDGKVVVWGDSRAGSVLQVPKDLVDVVDIATAPWFAAAVTKDGEVHFWGREDSQDSALFHHGPEVSNLKNASLGLRFGVGVRKDGSIVTWGTGDAVKNLPTGVSHVKSVWAGNNTAFALDADGVLYGWGSLADSVLPVPADLGPIIDLSVKGSTAIAKRRDGTLRRWGAGFNGGSVDTGLEKLGPVGAFSVIYSTFWAAYRSEPPASVRRDRAVRASSSHAGEHLRLTESGTYSVFLPSGSLLQTISVRLRPVEVGDGLPNGVLLVRAAGDSPRTIRWLRASGI